MTGKIQKNLGTVGFRLIKIRQIDHGNARQLLPYQPVSFQQPLNTLPDMFLLHTQQLAGGRNQLLLRQETVTGQKVIIQFKQNTGFHPPGIIAGHTQFDGKPVHGPERGFQSFIHQKVRIIVQQFNGTVAVQFISTHCQFSRQVVQRKEFHQLAHAHLKPEFFSDGAGLFPGNAGNLRQPFRFPLHNHQGLGTEMLHNPGRHPGADALDHPAAQIA